MTGQFRVIPPIDQDQAFAQLPPPWPVDLMPEITALVQQARTKLVVLDDDPTGTQTVYEMVVLTDWNVAALSAEFARTAPAFYILTNTRSLSAQAAAARIRDIAINLCAAARETGVDFSIVSRGDSTLRGHFPLETDVLAEFLGQSAARRLLIPFFAAGGRYTLSDVHYVAQHGRLVPAGDTSFARDATFGYRSSDLRDWVEEKSGGRIPAHTVASISLDEIRGGGPAEVQHRLEQLPASSTCIVNAVSDRDLEVVTLALLGAELKGGRFLPRTAASFVAARCGLSPRPLLTRADLHIVEGRGGLIVVGSHVPTTTAQLTKLLQVPGIASVRVDVVALLDSARRDRQIAIARAKAESGLRQGATVAIHTSRQLVTGASRDENLRIGQSVSDALIAIVHGLAVRPGYLLAKGGITSSDLATGALGVRRATVSGQLLPGVPVWQLGADCRWPDLPYIVFPGNVGGPEDLAAAVAALASPVRVSP